MRNLRRSLYFVLGLSLGACIVTTSANALTLTAFQPDPALLVLNCTSSNPNAGWTGYYLTVNWGDGTVSPNRLYQGLGTSSYTAVHPYALAGSYVITAKTEAYTAFTRQWIPYQTASLSVAVLDPPPPSIPITAAEAVPIIDSVKYGLTGLLSACIFAAAWRG